MKALSALLVAGIVLSAGCKGGGSSSSSGGGTSSKSPQVTSATTEITDILLSNATFGAVPSGTGGSVRPLGGGTTACSGGGTKTVVDSRTYGCSDPYTETVSGSMAVSFSSCSLSGVMYSGGFTVNYALSGYLSTPICPLNGGSYAQVTINGTESVPTGSLGVNGTNVPITSLTMTYSSLALTNLLTSPSVLSGSVSYSGKIGGVSVTGSCGALTQTCN